MKVFISYSRQDESAVTSMVEDLERARIDVWRDDELRGGEVWWTQILTEIHDCTVFLFALSDNSLYSQPCRAERGYAQDLGLPILPVQVGEVSSYRADPIFRRQLVDYRNPTAATGFALMGALNEHATHRTDLPDPLPEAPPIPYEYLQRVGAQIHDSAMLAPPVQAQLLFELRNALHEEEDDPTVVDDICNLLRGLRRRADVTYPVATEIDSMLGEVAPDSGQPGDAEVRPAATVPATDARPSGEGVPLFRRLNTRTKILAPSIEAAAPPTEQPSPAGTRRLSRRMILVALGGTAVLVAGGTAIKLITSGHGAKSSAPTLSGKPGAVLWRVSAGSAIIFSSPTLGDGSVFVAGYDNNVYALDEASGAGRWTAATGDRVRPSPAFADGRVYVASWDGNVYALDARTGEERWKTPAGPFPVSPVVADQTVYFGTTDGYVHALDAASGKVRWNTLTTGAASAAPTVADGVLYIGTDGHVYALDAPTGTVRWSTQIGGQVWSSPAVADGRVFLGNDDHSVYALHAGTGEVNWITPTGGAVYSSPAAGGGLIYFGSDDKNVYALDAGSGKVRWKTPTGKQVHSSPAVADGAVYVGSFDGFLYALGATDGAVRWKAGTGGEVWSSPTVAEKVVYVGSYDGKIYAVER
jgi:outer membrane protein assembly factor BamB